MLRKLLGYVAISVVLTSTGCTKTSTQDANQIVNRYFSDESVELCRQFSLSYHLKSSEMKNDIESVRSDTVMTDDPQERSLRIKMVAENYLAELKKFSDGAAKNCKNLSSVALDVANDLHGFDDLASKFRRCSAAYGRWVDNLNADVPSDHEAFYGEMIDCNQILRIATKKAGLSIPAASTPVPTAQNVKIKKSEAANVEVLQEIDTDTSSTGWYRFALTEQDGYFYINKNNIIENNENGRIELVSRYIDNNQNSPFSEKSITMIVFCREKEITWKKHISLRREDGSERIDNGPFPIFPVRNGESGEIYNFACNGNGGDPVPSPEEDNQMMIADAEQMKAEGQ